MLKFHRQQPGEGAVKKSIQKLSDHKRDLGTRLKHLKIIIGKMQAILQYSVITEIKSCFDFDVFYL